MKQSWKFRWFKSRRYFESRPMNHRELRQLRVVSGLFALLVLAATVMPLLHRCMLC